MAAEAAAALDDPEALVPEGSRGDLLDEPVLGVEARLVLVALEAGGLDVLLRKHGEVPGVAPLPVELLLPLLLLLRGARRVVRVGEGEPPAQPLVADGAAHLVHGVLRDGGDEHPGVRVGAEDALRRVLGGEEGEDLPRLRIDLHLVDARVAGDAAVDPRGLREVVVHRQVGEDPLVDLREGGGEVEERRVAQAHGPEGIELLRAAGDPRQVPQADGPALAGEDRGLHVLHPVFDRGLLGEEAVHLGVDALLLREGLRPLLVQGDGLHGLALGVRVVELRLEFVDEGLEPALLLLRAEAGGLDVVPLRLEGDVGVVDLLRVHLLRLFVPGGGGQRGSRGEGGVVAGRVEGRLERLRLGVRGILRLRRLRRRQGGGALGLLRIASEEAVADLHPVGAGLGVVLVLEGEGVVGPLPFHLVEGALVALPLAVVVVREDGRHGGGQHQDRRDREPRVDPGGVVEPVLGSLHRALLLGSSRRCSGEWRSGT